MHVRPRLQAHVLTLVLAILATSAQASPPPLQNAQGILETPNGMTLYTYAPDGSTGFSHCDGPCASVWPPYLADSGAHPAQGFSLTKRPDHTLQWSYQGQPLYRYAGDTKPGEARGDGINGVWHVVSVH